MIESLLIYILAAFAIHRLWIYEDIFKKPRGWAKAYNIKMLWCGPCFCFWAALLASPAFWFPEYFIPLAGYSVLRLLLLFGPKTEDDPIATLSAAPLTLSVDAAPEAIPTPSVFEAAAVPEPGCASCAEKAKIKTQPPAAVTHKKHLIIMTALSDFDPSYSLVTVIIDQCRAALKAGFYVELWGMDQMRINKLPADLVEALKGNKHFNCQGVIPHVGWLQDETTPEKEDKVYNALWLRLNKLNYVPTVITHDFVFQNWYLTIAKVMHRIAETPVKGDWYHQIHSSVGERPPEDIAQWRASIPKGHKIAAVNYGDIPHLMEYYKAPAESFVTIPNTRDARTFMHMPPDAVRIIDATRLHMREIVQVFPLSSPRMQAKGIEKVVDIFAALKKQGADVFLLIENAHANGEDGIARIKELKEYADAAGLSGNMAFTSDIVPESMAAGLTEDVTRSLFSVANLFCFPSVSEACGLVMLEAALAGNLMVLNLSVPVLADFIPHEYAIYVPWGSARQPASPVNSDGLAALIRDDLKKNRMNTAKRRVLRDFSIDALSKRMNELFDPAT